MKTLYDGLFLADFELTTRYFRIPQPDDIQRVTRIVFARNEEMAKLLLHKEYGAEFIEDSDEYYGNDEKLDTKKYINKLVLTRTIYDKGEE